MRPTEVAGKVSFYHVRFVLLSFPFYNTPTPRPRPPKHARQAQTLSLPERREYDSISASHFRPAFKVKPRNRLSGAFLLIAFCVVLLLLSPFSLPTQAFPPVVVVCGWFSTLFSARRPLNNTDQHPTAGLLCETNFTTTTDEIRGIIYTRD